MKMTIEEFLACPKGMPFEEYEKILTRIRRLEKKLYKLSEERDYLEDVLDMISLYEDSEDANIEWSTKFEKLQDVARNIQKYKDELESLQSKINY